MNLTDLQIRDGILATIQPQAGNAVMHNRWVLGLGLGESVPYLKVPASELVHAYMVTRTSVAREKLAVNSRSFKDTYTYKLWGLYSYRLGTNASNSENEFSAEIDNIQNLALAPNPRLIFDDLDYNIVQHNDWQIADIDVFDFGRTKLHVAQGTLEVILRVQT